MSVEAERLSIRRKNNFQSLDSAMNMNNKLATLALALLFPICMSGCGAVVKAIGMTFMKTGGKVAAKGTIKAGAKIAAGAADDVARVAAGTADDVARTTGRGSTGVVKNAAGVVVRGAARSAAHVAARGSLKAVASGGMHCAEKLNSIPYHLLSPVSRVTMRLLIQRYKRNQERLEELSIELNDTSLSDADAERIREEGERVKQEMDRISKKADELYRELG